MAETLAQEGEAWLVSSRRRSMASQVFILKKERVLFIFKKSNIFI